MQTILIRTFLALILLSLINPFTLMAATERRTALVIGNSQYDVGRLKNPVNDATDMAKVLQRLGFTVILKNNSRQQEMEEAIRDFGRRLKLGGVGLFFYAGPDQRAELSYSHRCADRKGNRCQVSGYRC